MFCVSTQVPPVAWVPRTTRGGRGRNGGSPRAEARTRQMRERRVPPARRYLVPALISGSFLAMLPHLSLGAFGILAVLQVLLPVLSLAALGLCLALASRRAYAAAMVLLVLASASLAPLMGPEAGTTCRPGMPVIVVSLNAGRDHADIPALAAAVGVSDPDVLVLVETSEPMLRALAAEFPGWAYTHRTGAVVTGGSVGTMILCRRHLKEQAPAVLQSEGALLDPPVAVIAHPRPGNIRVAGIHPAPPTHAPSS